MAPHLTELAETGMQFGATPTRNVPPLSKVMTGNPNKKNHVKFGYLLQKKKPSANS